MPKICQAPECNRAVFSHSFCQVHQYLRTDEKWLKTVQKQRTGGNKTQKIKPISDKQAKKLQKYEQGKKEKEKQLKEQDKWCCIFCGQKFREDDSVDWHHLHRRIGDLVHDMRYVFPSHTDCHIRIYHGSSYAVLSSQRWYNSFLKRLKEIDIELYRKELKKGDK